MDELNPFADGEAGLAYRQLFTALPVPAVLLDARGFIRLANRQACDFLGLSPAAHLQRRSMLQLLAVDDRQRLLWRLLDTSGLDTHEMRGIRLWPQSTRVVPCDLQLVRLSPSMTREPMTLTVMVDRSLEAELQSSQDLLRRQGQRLGDAIWASQSGFWEWDLDTNTLTLDERFAQILGYSHAELSRMGSRRLLEMVHPEDRQRFQKVVSAITSRDEATFSERVRMAHHAGGWVWLTNRGRVLDWDENDRPQRLGGAIHDISTEIEREESLRIAKEEAEASERMRAAWLANVGHEVRTPLNSVLGLVQLMQESPLEERQRDYLRRLAESAQLLRATLDDLLDNAKLEAGALKLERLPMDMRELVASTLAVFRHESERSGVRLISELTPSVPRVLIGDPLRLRQVINNLVGNALKFTAVGSVHLKIDGRSENDGQEFILHVGVRDTGSGIDPGVLPRLFTPFFQGEAGTTRRHGGTGLGLSICRRLVRLMGGEIDVDSALGRGSYFHFTARFGVGNTGLAEGSDTPPAGGADQESGKGVAEGAAAGSGSIPADAPDSSPGDRGPAADWQAMLLELQHRLMLQDHRALGLCEALVPHVGAPEAQTLRQVMRCLREFDFETASRVFDQGLLHHL